VSRLRFALALAWRETRGNARRFLGLVVCVTLGVAALSAVGSLAVSLERGIAREGRSLLGGDLEVRSARPLDAAVRDELDRLARLGASVVHVRELVGMVREPRSGRTLLVELKAPDAGYPLYGTLATAPAEPLARVLAADGALVAPELLQRLGLAVGDRLVLGDTELTIRGLVTAEPDRPATLFGLGPRVLLAPRTLDASGLVQLGSRVRHRVLIALPPALAARETHDALQAALPDVGVRVVGFDEAQPGMRRFFTQVTSYLGLLGLASLLVGGIGVASSISAFLRRRITTLAILKTLGADSRTLVLAYVVQTEALALVGVVAGVALGVAVAPLLAPALSGVLPFALDWRPDPWTCVRAAAMGLATALACAAWPLLRIRDVPPALVLRSAVDPALPRARRPWAAAIVIAAALVALALAQAHSVKVGLIFVAASAAALLLLALAARALAVAGRARSGAIGLPWRHGVASLARPGGHTGAVVIALGAAAMLLTAVVLLEQALAREIDHERRREAPSFFFVDVQPDQLDALRGLVRDADGTEPRVRPVVRARLRGVDGTPVTREFVEQRRRGGEPTWYFTREYVLTFLGEPPAESPLVRGRWWTADEAAARPLVSVEEEAARALGVDLGSRLTFDVQGTPVEAEVTSVRRVDWQSLSMNFFMILSPGALAGAPTTYVATARVPAGREPGVQDAIVRTLPNVTAIAVRDVLERVAAVLDRLAAAIRLIAAFTVATGLAVVIGALATTRSERLYESVVLRALGASRGTVARTFAVEYGCLGAAAGLAGAVLATILAWVVLRVVLDVPWTFDAVPLAASVVVTALVAIAVGFFGTYRLLGVKPLAVLRGE
jgi:putative ABC transport system permease protein